jgi:hypothetical protein
LADLIQIVPELAPQVGGVAAYADLLAAALAPHGFDTLFVAPRQPGRAPRRDLLEVEPRAEALAEALRDRAAAGSGGGGGGSGDGDGTDVAGARGGPGVRVLLHYVGYGYQQRGCPQWLVRGLELAAAQIQLVTLFHEIWVGGPPWTHRFWLLPRQRDLVRRLAGLSRCCVMTAPAAAGTLHGVMPVGHGDADRITVAPTPSTLGEPERSAWPAERKPQLVILGLPPVRNRTHTLGRQALLRFCRRAGIAEVHDIGPPLADPPAPLDGLPLTVHGVLPAAQVSRLLLESRALAVYYPRQAAAKSTLIAAGMASGCPVFNCAELLPADDGLSHFRTAAWDGRDWRQAGEEAWALYHRRRSWNVVAGHLAARLR